MKMVDIKQANASSVNLVMYFTKADKSNATRMIRNTLGPQPDPYAECHIVKSMVPERRTIDVVIEIFNTPTQFSNTHEASLTSNNYI